MSSFCAQCGATLATGARFCEECGTALVGGASRPASVLTHRPKRTSWLWMMVGGVTVLLIVGGVIFVIRDWLNPDARANQLFVEASQLVKSAQEAEQTSYAEAFRLYQAALAKAETITSKYQSSQLAVQFTSGQTKIGSYTFAELRKIVPRARARAEVEEDFLACALFVANTIQEVSEKNSTLSDIAIWYARAKQYDRAMEVANSIESAEKAIFLSLLADTYAKVGQYERALQVANGIEDVFPKAWALGSIALEYAKAGQHDKAVRIANSIEKDIRKAWALVEVYTQAGQFDRALQVANTIIDVPQKTGTLVGIYAKAGQYDRALQLANAMENGLQKSMASAEIASAYVRAGQYDRALQIANTLKREDGASMQILSAHEDGALMRIVSEYIDASQWDYAIRVANKVGQNNANRATAITAIGIVYANTGQYDRALQTVDSAEIIESRRVSSKARVLAAIGGRYAQTGQKMDENARKLLREAIKSVGDSSTFTEQGGTPENPLLGKWRNPNTNETFEFFKDGTVNVFGGGPPGGGGEYAVIDDSHVRLQVFRLSGPGPTVWKFSVSRDQLTLTSPEGRVAMYRRVK